MNMDSSSFKSTSHLSRLRQLSRHYQTQERKPVTIASLAEQLQCSDRNVSKLMVAMESYGWVTWAPGKGRGNVSTLTLLVTFEEALTQALEEWVKAGKINQAHQLAEQFDGELVFQENLPLWLGDAQTELNKQNTLVYIAPYQLPEWRPHQAHSVRSVMLIDSIYNTLLRFDPHSQSILPELAHAFENKGDHVRIRLRSDVTFHNGKRLSGTDIKANFERRLNEAHPFSVLFRHLDSINVEGQWVTFYLRQNDPVFLNLLCDKHTAIMDCEQPHKPIGTGPYYAERLESHHWTLKRNPRYFGIGGLIDMAEFWSLSPCSKVGHAHIQQMQRAIHLDNVGDDHSKQNGCSVLHFFYHKNQLSKQERAWIVHHFRKHADQRVELANSLMNEHQDKGFHLFESQMTKPKRPVVIEIRENLKAELAPLIEILSELGVEWTIQSPDDEKRAIADVGYGCYVFGDDRAYQYYEWMLASDAFTRCLSEKEKNSLVQFVDGLMRESEDSHGLLEKLFRAEDWLIQNYHYAPLWREHIVYSQSEELHGAETDRMGVMSLKNMWLE
ncbi:SgrR family transcriptional regulator [Vibrio harveyi]|uniref:SgrR family transcriptional regulator n=1 Tax=Vibrio harveyi TaxID=669 RepID=UPI0018F1E6A2|nr:SgrR family transcriptional regulator [Vibrio harveyi]